MSVVGTSTAALATAYGNQRKVDRTQNGVLWAVHWGGADTLEFRYSTDDGATWNAGGNINFGGTNNTSTPNASLFIDLDDYAHVVYKNRHNGWVMYQRGTPNAARTAWTWSGPVTVYDNTTWDYPDVVVHREGTGWKVHIVTSQMNTTPNNQARYFRFDVASDGTITDESDVGGLTIGGSYSVATHTWPSIEFSHAGDGKTIAGGTPHLYAAWSAGATGAGKGVRFKKATYSAGSWTWGTEREIDSASFANAGRISSVFDGSRVVVAYADSASVAAVKIRERDAADTTTTTRTPPALSDGTVLGVSVSYDDLGGIHLAAIGDTSDDPQYVSYDRAAASWGTWAAFASADARADTLSLERGYSDNRIGVVYTDGTASPYNVTFDSIVVNKPPNAPTLTNPVGGATFDRTATQRFAWDFNDPDAGDSQSQYELRYRVVGAATWTTVGKETSNEFHDFAAATFAAGDYEWQARTWDAQGEVGPWSASEFFTAADPPAGPSITDPTAGQTIPTETYVVKWSAAEQDAYQLRRVADNAGAPDTATVYFDTGTVTSGTARSRSVAFETNNRWEHVQVRVERNGLWSDWASVRAEVSYTPPATPTAVVTGAPGSLDISATHPTPTGSQPDVTSMDIYRRETLTTAEIRVATQVAPLAVWRDWMLAHGVDYEYRVVAIGDNDTSTSSAWEGAALPEPELTYGAGGY